MTDYKDGAIAGARLAGAITGLLASWELLASVGMDPKDRLALMLDDYVTEIEGD